MISVIATALFVTVVLSAANAAQPDQDKVKSAVLTIFKKLASAGAATLQGDQIPVNGKASMTDDYRSKGDPHLLRLTNELFTSTYGYVGARTLQFKITLGKTEAKIVCSHLVSRPSYDFYLERNDVRLSSNAEYTCRDMLQNCLIQNACELGMAKGDMKAAMDALYRA